MASPDSVDGGFEEESDFNPFHLQSERGPSVSRSLFLGMLVIEVFVQVQLHPCA